LSLPWLAGSAGALLLGLLAGPVVAYWLGGKVAGDYADPGGLLVFWTSIYGDALGFGGAGLIFLFGPLLMFQIGWGVLRVWKNYLR
jgi:hypothetical protein